MFDEDLLKVFPRYSMTMNEFSLNLLKEYAFGNGVNGLNLLIFVLLFTRIAFCTVPLLPSRETSQLCRRKYVNLFGLNSIVSPQRKRAAKSSRIALREAHFR